MQRSALLLVRQTRYGNHPKDRIKKWFKPHYGATKFKWTFPAPYERPEIFQDRLLHFPDISKVTGKPINWMHGEPKSGYEMANVLGANTLELKGMPMGRTPEYMQERLRRFFGKFGLVQACRCIPHSHDPYQCEGTAFVTFRSHHAAWNALRAPLKFPLSLHSKVVSMRSLDTDKTNDPMYITKAKHYNKELISIARQLHSVLTFDGRPLDKVFDGIWEQGRHKDGAPRLADLAVYKRFGTWKDFATFIPFDELFSVEDEHVYPRIVGAESRERILVRAAATLDEKLHAELSVWWREGKIPLPEHTQRNVDLWDRKPKLPGILQLQSRSHTIQHIHCEKHLFKIRVRQKRNEARKHIRADYQDKRRKAKEEKLQLREERSLAAQSGQPRM